MLLEKLSQLDPSILNTLLEDFMPLLHKKSMKKNSFLHQEGFICNSLYLLESGMARSYYYKEGKDITAHFAFENEAITAIDSFIQGKRSRYTIALLEDATVYALSKQELEAFLADNPLYEKMVRLFMEQIYMDLEERLESLLFYTAKERLQILVRKHPNIQQRVPAKHIASYIGLSAETYSRIQNSM